jgi:pyruvate/2-oxoglutarate dehydrogenase complex dihydrolipoamide dehydrogenase (E3) component
VGGGPAGITAALQARELGADVTLLEAGQIGGTSLNHGPAPVRTLARAARLARDWSSWDRFGLEGPPPVPNLEAILANAARVARYAHDSRIVSTTAVGAMPRSRRMMSRLMWMLSGSCRSRGGGSPG